jgi:hypothetical protein
MVVEASTFDKYGDEWGIHDDEWGLVGIKT